MALTPAESFARTRAVRALRRPHNWVQLGKFAAVGASGYAINLAVYTALLRGAGFHCTAAATCSFLVAVTNNYTWNRLWTFHDQRGHVGWQGLRFLVVALVAYGANLALLAGFIALGLDKVLA
jgi:putative flippase GtrA